MSENAVATPLRIPSCYQLGDSVRACGVKGVVTAITFSSLGGCGKVLYDVAHNSGVMVRVLSEDVKLTKAPYLYAVPKEG